MNLFQREACQVEVLLGADNVDLFAVVYGFADEWHILQTEQRDIPAQNLVNASKSALDCPIEGSLAKD